MFVYRVGGRFSASPWPKSTSPCNNDREVKLCTHIGGGHNVNRLPVRRLSQMVPTERSKRPKTDEKGDRSEFGSMGANEKARRSDKQRSSRSHHGATVLHARRPPRDVRMSRVLSIPDARIKSSNPFVLEPYWKRLKRCAGCMSEFLHDPPAFVVFKREWHTYFYAGRQCLSWRKMCYHYSTLCIIHRHPNFDIAKVVINLEQ